MRLQGSYFSLRGLNPFPMLSRLMHPYCHGAIATLRGHPLQVRWTARAEQQLAARRVPLSVEMQLYFSCVVKKRVLFPAHVRPGAVALDDRLRLTLRTVASDRCDPVRFATHYPAGAELDSGQAQRMRAKELLLDYHQGQWQGEFTI